MYISQWTNVEIVLPYLTPGQSKTDLEQAQQTKQKLRILYCSCGPLMRSVALTQLLKGQPSYAHSTKILTMKAS